MKRKFTFFLVLSAIMLLGGCEKAKNVFPDPSGEPPVLVVRSTISLDKEAGSKVVDVATNTTEWSASVEGDVSWITLTPKAGAPGTLEVAVAENDIMDERTANVIITAAGGSLTQTLRVVQFGTAKKILFVQGVRHSVKGAGATFTLDVMTNCPTFDWQIDPECDWIKDVTPVQPSSKAFEEWSSARTFEAAVNPLESARSATISANGTNLGLGATASITIEQTPNVVMANVPAKFISYSGKGSAMEAIFDGKFTTFGETSYQTADGGPSMTLEVEVKADKLFQIQFYPRSYDPTKTPIGLGSVSQYPTDMELWVKTTTKDWTKVQDIQVRGTGSQGGSKKYPNLVATQVPYYLYDGAAISDVRQVRFVVTSGNSATGENNQFWNASEIQFLGVAATVADPVKVPITSAAYSWVSSDVGMPNGDGGAIGLLIDGIKASNNYWQTPYGAVTAEQAEAKGKVGSTEDAVAAGTTITLNLDKAYANLSELRYYIRGNTTQTPKVFEIWVDETGNGRYTMVKEFTGLTYVALPGFTSIKLNSPVKAKSIQIYVKETSATENKMFMAASEIEAYIQP